MLPLWIVATSIALAPVPVGGKHAVAFQDVSLDTRCEALRQYVKAFADEHLPAAGYADVACAEGVGLGGARYNLDFKLGTSSYRLDVALDDGAKLKTRLCDTNGTPVVCSVNPPYEPLVFERKSERINTAAAAKAAVQAFEAKGLKTAQLLPTIDRWVTTTPTKSATIFGQGYDAFVSKQLAYTGDYPVQEDKAFAKTKFSFLPAKDPSSGTITFKDPVAAAVLTCFQCSDAACLNGKPIVYEFSDRLLSLTTLPDQAKGKDMVEPTTAGWFMTSATPMQGDGWKFSCGASRFSLQNINL